MTKHRDPDKLIAAYLADGMEVLPDRVADAVLDEVHRTRQRAVLGPWRTRSMFKTVLATAAVFAALAFGGTLYLGQRGQPAVVGGPSQTPGASATATEPASPSVGPSSSAVQPGSGMFAYIKELQAYQINDQIWVANTDGTGARPLTPPQGGRLSLGGWSADGSRLVFSLAPSIETLGYPIFGPARLYLTDASGGGPQLVDTGCVAPCAGDSDAAFSSDGGRLVFVRGTAGASVIATIDLSTGLVTELASTQPRGTGRYPSGAPGTSNPRWSPDGKQIVFIRDVPSTTPPPPDGGVDDQLAAVFVVDADGRNLHRIGPSAQAADWSPDGSRIVVGSVSDVITRGPSPSLDVRRQGFDILTMRPDGTDVRRLTSDQVSHLPRWSSDGRILFLRDPDPYADQPGPIEYWVMDADGGNATQLTGSSEFQAALVSGLVRPQP